MYYEDKLKGLVNEFKGSPIVEKASAVAIVCFGLGYLLNSVSRIARAGSFRRW